MVILFSGLATVDFDGVNYYNNEIRASISRYKPFCDKLICIAHLNKVDASKHDPINMEGIEFVFIDKINSPKSFLFGPYENRPIIQNAVKRADACIVHVFSMHCGEVIKAARKFGKPVCNVVVGCPWQAYWNYNILGKFLAPVNYLKLRFLQRKATHSIYVTNYFLQHRYPTKGLLTNCSNVQIYAGVEDVLKSRINRIETYSEDTILKIGTVAAIDVPYKGQKYVIKALANLEKLGIERFEYHLAGAGDISMLKKIADYLGISDKIIFHGAIPHEQILDFFDEMDIYIQPSKQEGLPRALIEAMSRGCLCIGSRIAGIPELLPETYLFPKGNSKKISQILLGINKNNLIEQAQVNFDEAKKYNSDIINKRRNVFLSLFLSKSLLNET